jgi:hypothetical protein
MGDRSYKNHLDGYNQLALLEGKGPSARHEIFYFGGPELGAVRADSFKYQFLQPTGRLAGSEDHDRYAEIYNIRQDPFERVTILNYAEGAPAQFSTAGALTGGPRQGLPPARVHVQSEGVHDRKSPTDAVSSPTRIPGARASTDRRTRQRRCR